MSTAVKLEALAFLRLYKLAVESNPGSAQGILLGVHEASQHHIIVSNMFLTPQESEESETSPSDYNAEIMKSFEAVNADSEQVGIFFTGNTGSVLSESSLQQLYKVQSVNPHAIGISFDLGSFRATRRGPRAFKLSPAMMSFFSSHGRNVPAFGDAVIIEVPLTYTISPLMEGFLIDSVNVIDANVKGTSHSQQFLERSVDQLGRSVDDMISRKQPVGDKPRRGPAPVAMTPVEAVLQVEAAKQLRKDAVVAARTLLGL